MKFKIFYSILVSACCFGLSWMILETIKDLREQSEITLGDYIGVIGGFLCLFFIIYMILMVILEHYKQSIGDSIIKENLLIKEKIDRKKCKEQGVMYNPSITSEILYNMLCFNYGNIKEGYSRATCKIGRYSIVDDSVISAIEKKFKVNIFNFKDWLVIEDDGETIFHDDYDQAIRRKITLESPEGGIYDSYCYYNFMNGHVRNSGDLLEFEWRNTISIKGEWEWDAKYTKDAK